MTSFDSAAPPPAVAPAVAPAAITSATALADAGAAARRRLGLGVLAGATALVGVQGAVEWVLPMDPMALAALARVLPGAPAGEAVVLAWAAATIAALAWLAWLAPRARSPWGVPAVAAVAGALVGASRLAAGGTVAALLMLLLAGVATLGWQRLRHGGGPLLGAAAATASLADVAASAYATLAPVAIGLALLFAWIERVHLRSGERRLVAALEERDGLIHALDASRAALERAQAARSALVAGIGHDLRQPLQAVRLFGDALAPHLAPAARPLLDRQRRAADDAVAMLDTFGDYSALEQGRLVPRPEVLDLRALLDAVAAGLAAVHPQARIAVRGRPRLVKSDRSQLGRIVQNLAVNALKHAAAFHAVHARAGAATRVRLVLAVRAPLPGGGLVIDVLDNGPGIPEAARERIFEPWVQLPGSAPGGRGLGLAIVRGLAEALGLALAPVRSVAGRGTRFRVLIPAAQQVLLAAAHGTAAVGHAPAADPAAGCFAGRLLAVLDDEAAPREALVAALEAAGASVIAAGDARALRERLDASLRFPDALLFDLDLGTPEDGVQLARALRREWETPVPLVVLTGRAGALANTALPPAAALLAKPVGLPALAAALAPLLAPAALAPLLEAAPLAAAAGGRA